MARHYQKLLDVLVWEQNRRLQRQDMVKDELEGYDSPLWVIAERTAMLNAVNAIREQAGKLPITVADIFQVERTAAGHIDYSRKFALYCAELAEA